MQIRNTIEELSKPQVLKKEDIYEEINRHQQTIRILEGTWSSINQNLDFVETANYALPEKIKIGVRQGLNTYWVMNFPNNYLIKFPLNVSPHLKEGASFKVELRSPHTATVITRAGREVPKFFENDLKSIEASELDQERATLKRQFQNLEFFEKNEWRKELSDREKQERIDQVNTLKNRLKYYEFELNKCNQLFIYQIDIKLKMQRLLQSKFIQKVNFKRITYFRPSMTFVQNTQYRNAVTYYQETFNALGINLEIFDSFEQITEYGVREMPQVYELWVLISIIKTLEGAYGYQPKPADLERLVKEISPKNVKMNRELTLQFKEGLPDRQVTLFYQKTLPNGKRPDFMLEILTNNNTVYLVLDAKFKNYSYQKNKDKDVVEELNIIKKKYSGNKHHIFIIHPCTDPELSNLGGKSICFEENSPTAPFHQYGYFSSQPNFTDNLKKVLGMAFEYLIDCIHNAKQPDGTIDQKPEKSPFCLCCGGEDVELNPSETDRIYFISTCKNKDCGHVAYFDNCWNCKTKLYKHGRYWDYHRTSVWSEFDIHCPNCGLTVADYPG